jgi:hypothetical protein
VSTPQRNRIRIFGRGRDLIRDCGGRPMRQAGITIEPSQTLDAKIDVLTMLVRMAPRPAGAWPLANDSMISMVDGGRFSACPQRKGRTLYHDAGASSQRSTTRKSVWRG